MLRRKHWAAGSVIAEEGTAVEMMARMELGSAGWVVVGMRMLGWWRIWLRMRWGRWERSERRS